MGSVRALFCFSSNDTRTIFLDKRFPTVERKAKRMADRMEESGRYQEYEDFEFPHLPPDYGFVSLPFSDKFITDPSLFPVPQATSPIGQIPPSNFLSCSDSSKVHELLEGMGISSPIWPVVHIIRVRL